MTLVVGVSVKLNIINANSEVDRMVALNQYQIEYVQPLEIKAEYSDKVLTFSSKNYPIFYKWEMNC